MGEEVHGQQVQVLSLRLDEPADAIGDTEVAAVAAFRAAEAATGEDSQQESSASTDATTSIGQTLAELRAFSDQGLVAEVIRQQERVLDILKGGGRAAHSVVKLEGPSLAAARRQEDREEKPSPIVKVEEPSLAAARGSAELEEKPSPIAEAV